jgi:tetratricopeptide (TPR) repeat protein
MNQAHNPNSKDGSEGISRRQAIIALISTPAAVFGVTQGLKHATLHPEEVLALCAANLPLIWRLYFEGGLTEVGQILPGYISQLQVLAEHPSRYQQKAATLASQAYQLASLLALQYQNFGAALGDAKQAFDYGKLAQDPNLQTASLIRQGQVYFYLKRPRQRLMAYEQARQISKASSPLLQGRVYIGLTEVHSDLKHETQAKQFLDLAHVTFPARYEEDPNFAYTHFNAWSLSGFEGVAYLNLQQAGQAWDAFERVAETVPQTPVPNRVELNVRQASASVALGDLEQSCAYVQQALMSALAAGNQLRCTEIYGIYDDMQQKWGNEPRVKELEPLFV